MDRTEIERGQRVTWIAGGRVVKGTVQEGGRVGTPGMFALVQPDGERAGWVEIARLRVTG